MTDILRILVVEDVEDELETCRATVETYQHERNRNIELVECSNVTQAFAQLDNSFDGAIIDLRLGADGDEGNEVIKKINTERFPIPIMVLTGTPNAVDPNLDYVGVFKKGDADAGFYNLLDSLWRIYDTGITRILGGRGIIHACLGKLFWNNLFPQIDKWTQYGQAHPGSAEKALLRHAVNHLIQLIDEDIEHCFPEEFYLHPPLTEDMRTGSILTEREGGRRFVVMSPSCDLVVRGDGKRKTDRILVVEVVSPQELFPWYDGSSMSATSKTKRRDLDAALKNNRGLYYHCLPETEFGPLGFIDFRRLLSFAEDELKARFQTPPEVQVSPPFAKEIVARFSSYYARQGQPDIHFGTFLEPA